MMELTLEEFLCMLMAKIAKRHDEHSNLIKEIQASTDFSLRNQEASIKALRIQEPAAVKYPKGIAENVLVGIVVENMDPYVDEGMGEVVVRKPFCEVSCRKLKAFEQFHANLSAGVLPHTAVTEPAGPSVAADKGKAPMPDLDIPAEFLAEDAQARKRFEEEQASERLAQRLRAEDLAQEDLPHVSEERAKELDDLMMRMTDTDWLNLMMQVGSNPALARELLGADVNEENFIERMHAIKEKKKRALADLRYRALKGQPMKKSEVTQMMRNLVKNQWCAAHNGTITMKDVKAMNKQQLVEEYENICRRLERDRLLSAQYNLFRPKPAITEPPSKRQRVERVSSQPASVPATITHTADPDSADGGSSNPAGSATPMAGSAASNPAGGAFGAPVTDSTVTTTAAMDSAGSRRQIGVSPFADSVADPSPFISSIAGGPSPSNVSADHIPIALLFGSISGGINEFFLESDEEEQKLVDKLPDDEIVDPRVKVETVFEFASSPPRSRRKHLGVRRDDFLWDKPVEDFFSSKSGGKYFTYLKELLPHVYCEDLLLLHQQMNRYFRLNPKVDVGLELWRDVNMLCQSLHSDDMDDFWSTQDEWIVSSWKLYPKSSVHVLDLTNGKTVLTVPPSYCRDIVVAGNIIQTVQDGLRQAYECIASAPLSLLTLKPLPKIDPKDKGKKKIEEEDESESESDGIPEAEKKFKQLESDEEMARKIQEEWEGEEERNRLAEEKATNEALIRNFDDIKARIEADRLLAEKLQEQEREQFTIEERAKFLHDTIAAQRKFLAQQRSEAIRNRPPTKNQLRNQMMTYLKHVGNFKHSELKTKKFEEIQALYEKIKRSDEDFISIGSAEDERLIKRVNEKGIDSSKSEVIKEESVGNY
ncbi:hypothetical protein Tco_1043168 [Tanacetum coccineum]|uniref:Uncharacterized protein n=1 Tax=Tanacetum coccineum TaxID=301880 RepID=A0ABQ5GLM9_9ASTR